MSPIHVGYKANLRTPLDIQNVTDIPASSTGGKMPVPLLPFIIHVCLWSPILAIPLSLEKRL